MRMCAMHVKVACESVSESMNILVVVETQVTPTPPTTITQTPQVVITSQNTGTGKNNMLWNCQQYSQTNSCIVTTDDEQLTTAFN